MEAFWTIVLGAVVVESIINIIRQVEGRNKDWRYWGSLAAGLILGPVIGIAYGIDLFRIAGLEGQWEWVQYLGAVLTGLIMSRGANFVNDIWDRLLAYKR